MQLSHQKVQHIPNAETLKKHVLPLYIMSDYMKSKEDYIIFQDRMYTIMKGCIEHKDCREYPIKFKFYADSPDTFTLQLRHFIVNMFLWYPYVELNRIKFLNEKYIINCETDITASKFPDFINDVLIATLQEYNVKNTVINYDLSETLYNLRCISIDFSLILGLPMNAESIIQIYNDNSRMREIMTTKFPDDMQPSDIEDSLHDLMNEEIEIFKSVKNNPIGVILRAETGIKHKQLSEFTVNGGLKPSLDGKTIPIPINSNTMIGGLNEVSSLYIDGLGARKSLIMNKYVMGGIRPEIA